MNKPNDEILNIVISTINDEIERLKTSFEASKNLSIDAPNRMQSRYDTMGIEAAWLSDGLAKKIEERKKELNILKSIQDAEISDVIGIKSLIELKDDSNNKISKYFLLPVAGGIKINYMGNEIMTISKDSPIAKELFGKKEGDSIELNGRTYYILSVN
jgi:hypothetical protein